MENKNFFLSIVAIVISAFFFGFLIFVVMQQQHQNLVTTADIERARAIARELEK